MQRQIVFRRSFYGEEKGPNRRWEECVQEVHLAALYCSTCTKMDEERIQCIIQSVRWPIHNEEEVDTISEQLLYRTMSHFFETS